MTKDEFYIIGLTGGIGSGKSMVAKLASEHFRAEVIYTDDVAREQMKAGGISYKLVHELLGDSILDEAKEIDRRVLSKLMFEDPSLRQRINELTHPPVHEYVMQRIEELRQDRETNYVIIETALLIEAGYASFCDAVWYVYAPEADRAGRLAKSRGYSAEKIENIFKAQKKEAEYRKIASFVIDNGDNESEASIIEQLRVGIMQLKER